MNLVRAYSYANDYAITEGWRQKHGQPPLPPAIFGSNVEGEPIPGVVVYDSETGEDYAAAWLYKDRCGVLCWMAWTVTNPDVPAAKAVAAIDTAEDFLETIATEEGFLIMVGMFKQESLVRHFTKRLGFNACDSDKGHFMTTKELSPCP